MVFTLAQHRIALLRRLAVVSLYNSFLFSSSDLLQTEVGSRVWWYSSSAKYFFCFSVALLNNKAQGGKEKRTKKLIAWSITFRVSEREGKILGFRTMGVSVLRRWFMNHEASLHVVDYQFQRNKINAQLYAREHGRERRLDSSNFGTETFWLSR